MVAAKLSVCLKNSDCKEVFIKKIGTGILLLPKDQSVWDAWEKSLLRGGQPLLTEGDRLQDQQEREGLDELFT